MRVQSIVSSALLLSALLVVGLFAAPQPAEACKPHDIGLPQSAAADGAIARFIEATDGLSLKAQHQWIRSQAPEEQALLRAEVRALPKEERRELTKMLRQAPKQKKIQRMAANKSQAAPAGS